MPQNTVKTNTVKIVNTPVTSPNATRVQNNAELPFDKTVTPQETQEDRNNVQLTENDIDKLIKKYAENPTQIFDALGIKFTDEQKEKLAEYIDDEKSLKSFLQFVAKEHLSNEDIIAGIEKLESLTKTDWLTRIKNVAKSVYYDGFEEAFKLAQSERVYKAEKMSQNMEEIRAERQDFSSEGVAEIGYSVMIEPKIKENTMHFVTKKNTQNVHLYDENSVFKATIYMAENTDKADLYTANAVEIESMTNANNQTKYKGSTIINVTQRMTDAPEMKSTMMSVGKKSDMNDEYFDNITDNLFKNPRMEQTIQYMCTKKDAKGNDLFSANNMNTTSFHLVNKEAEYCQNYHLNMTELGDKYNLSGDTITKLTQMVSENPEIKDFIVKELTNTNNLDENQLISKCNDLIKDSSNKTLSGAETESETVNSNETSTTHTDCNTQNNTANNTNKTTNAISVTEEKTEQEIQTTQNESIKIDGVTYERAKILAQLEKQYGTNGAKVLQNLEKKPEFVTYIKTYAQNKSIVEGLITDPDTCIANIKKLKNASCTITPKEMNDLIALSTNSKTSKNVISMVERHGAPYTIKVLRTAKLNNKFDDAMTLIETTDNRKKQKASFENLLDGNTSHKLYNSLHILNA